MDISSDQFSTLYQNQQINPIIPRNNSSKTKIVLIVIIIFLFVISVSTAIYLIKNKNEEVNTQANQNIMPTITQTLIISTPAPTPQIDLIIMLGSSMNPNYIHNHSYSIDKEYYKSHSPQRNDVILLITQSTNGPIEIIKRIIGLPGETIQIKDGEVYINGNILSEPYILEKDNTKLYTETIMKEGQTIDIPQDQYFVMGDNRKNSSDSRDWGLLKQENIIGKLE